MALAGVVLWSLSGVLHPIMVQLQPEPVRQQLDPRVLTLNNTVDPRPLLRAAGLATIQDLRVIEVDGRPAYQVTRLRGEQRLVFDARDGSIVPDGERRYAEWLARQFTGEPRARVAHADLVTTFGSEYSYINRLLPVWRIEFDRPDHLRAFVDTRAGRLGTLVDDRHALAAGAFNALHRWLWLAEVARAVRLVLLTAMLTMAVLVVGIGIWIYALRWRHAAGRWGLRRAHRVAGLGAVIAGVILPLSGGTHLVYEVLRGDAASRAPQPEDPIAVDDLHITPEAAQLGAGGHVSAISLARLGSEPAYRLLLVESLESGPRPGAGHTHHESSPSGRVTAGFNPERGRFVWVSTRDGHIMDRAEKSYMVARALRVVGVVPTGGLQLIEHFDGEYGFVFKRLPVWRVEFQGGIGVFVDPADGAIAAITDSGDRAEQWLFAHVHKLEWLVGWIGGTWRDRLAMTLAAVLGVSAVLGGVLALRRRS